MCMNDPGIVEGELKVICLILSFTFLSSATCRLDPPHSPPHPHVTPPPPLPPTTLASPILAPSASNPNLGTLPLLCGFILVEQSGHQASHYMVWCGLAFPCWGAA